MTINNKSSCNAGDCFAKLTVYFEKIGDQEKTTIVNGLGFLAQSLDELHAKIDKLSEDQSKIRYDAADSVEKRLKAVGLIK